MHIYVATKLLKSFIAKTTAISKTTIPNIAIADFLVRAAIYEVRLACSESAPVLVAEAKNFKIRCFELMNSAPLETCKRIFTTTGKRCA